MFLHQPGGGVHVGIVDPLVATAATGPEELILLPDPHIGHLFISTTPQAPPLVGRPSSLDSWAAHLLPVIAS